MSELVSVVLPVRNAAGTIEEQLAALAAQQPTERWEVVVVDNCSTDATPTLLRQWKQRIPELRIVDACDGVGDGYARNVGVVAARGDLLLFCDGDDIVWPGWVSAFAAALREHRLVAGAIDHRRFTPVADPTRPSISMTSPPGRSEWLPFADTANAAVRRADFEAVGGFDERLRGGVDKDLSWRLQLAGVPLHFEPAAVISKRPRPLYRATFRQYYAYGLGNIELYRKFRPHDMPRENLRYVALQYWWLGTGWRRLPPEYRRYWFEAAGMRLGRALASARARTLYP